jgi:hypothetical protein
VSPGSRRRPHTASQRKRHNPGLRAGSWCRQRVRRTREGRLLHTVDHRGTCRLRTIERARPNTSAWALVSLPWQCFPCQKPKLSAFAHRRFNSLSHRRPENAGAGSERFQGTSAASNPRKGNVKKLNIDVTRARLSQARSVLQHSRSLVRWVGFVVVVYAGPPM